MSDRYINKLIYKDRLFQVFRFVNPYETNYIGMEFLVPEHSDPKYRGLPATRKNIKRLSKMFLEVGKRLGKLAVILCLFGAVAKADMTWKVFVSNDPTGQSLPSETTISTDTYRVPLAGASMKCVVEQEQVHAITPVVTLHVRDVACEFVEGSVAATVTGCIEEETSQAMNQLLIKNLGKFYQVAVSCENVAKKEAPIK